MTTSKLESGYILELDLPLENQRFYSEDYISQDELDEAIATIIGHHQIETFLKPTENETHITIDENKTLKIKLHHKIDETTENFKKRKRRQKLDQIQTEIIMQNNSSVPGTEVCVALIKALQKNHQRSIYFDDAGGLIGGQDIQKIWIDKDFLYSMKHILEKDSDEDIVT